ncbi:Acyl carrier protein phosphodiesterase [Vibrio sp. NH-UV-68]
MRWLCAFIRVNNLAGFFDVNFLAHLHIADHCQSSLLGNLLGDFVKGNPDTQYPAMISQGVRLHRFVDSYTDSHSQVEQIRALFPNGVRRYSGIALDMFWDHCLAVNGISFMLNRLAIFAPKLSGKFKMRRLLSYLTVLFERIKRCGKGAGLSHIRL